MNSTDGFHVYGWMVSDLHLEGSELITFAVVHQFAQSQAGIYKGNTSYLSQWFGWTEKTARKHLASLVEKGLIKEVRGREDNKTFCHYDMAPGFYKKHPVNFTGSPGNNFQNHPENFSESTPKILPGEQEYIENENKGTFIPPTPQEVADYARQRGFRSPEGFAAHFIDFYTSGEKAWHLSNGKPMKDWKRSVITWEPNNKDRIFPTTSTSKKEIAPASRDQFINYLR